MAVTHPPGPPPLSSKKHVLYVEHRYALSHLAATGCGGEGVSKKYKKTYYLHLKVT